MAGKFYGVGVGPGDPELLTLKAKRILEEVDIICFPRSKVEKDSIALNIVKKAVTKEFEVMDLLFPMSHDQTILNKHWDAATEDVVKKLKEGKNVAFITIGDPMLYSTYAYVLKRIKKHHPKLTVETIPGITAMAASCSWINEPLAEGDEKVAIIPAFTGVEDLKEIIKKFDNIVLMKVSRNYDDLVELLEEMGLKEKAFYISRCGHPDQFNTRNMDSLKGKPLNYMSLIIIRKGTKEK